MSNILLRPLCWGRTIIYTLQVANGFPVLGHSFLVEECYDYQDKRIHPTKCQVCGLKHNSWTDKGVILPCCKSTPTGGKDE